MEDLNRKQHWENIYQSKALNEVSWYQPVPETSLSFLRQFNIPTEAKIIDIGGGDSFLVDHLLEAGYANISVLDISASALEKAKKRLGEKSSNVKWIVADAANFQPEEEYDFWHDRAAFHFLTQKQEISNYVDTVKKWLKPNGILVIGTFSEAGPKKCSGIEIKQYSEASMDEIFSPYFEKTSCTIVDHKTPFDTIQNFIFCSFKKRP